MQKNIVTAHSEIVDHSLVKDNIQYIRNFIRCHEENNTSSIDDKDILDDYNRSTNVKLILEYEKLIQNRLGDKFDYDMYKGGFGVC